MSDLLKAEQKERMYVTALAAVGLLRFLNLGFLDLQAWDEALYAIRAEGILKFGGFFDQTPFAIGGLYSSLHPPLYVWLTSLAYVLFGVSEFSARFFSALFGGLTLLVIYRLGKELDSPKLGFVAAMLYGLNPFVTFYARQGQFDTTLVFLLSLAILFYLKLERDGGMRYAIIAGLAVGAALMTKLFIGLGVPLTIILWKAVTQKEDQKTSWKPFLVSLGAAVLLAGPWHIYMTIARGFGNPLFLVDASAVLERSFFGAEGNTKSLEFLYFVNQLIVLFPLGVVWFGYGVYRAFRERERSWVLFALWFAVFFIVFSLMRTKLSVYVLPMLVPASLIGAKILLEFSSATFSHKLGAALLGGTGLSFLWASRQPWRDITKPILAALLKGQLPHSQLILTFLPFFIILCCVLFLTYLVYRNDVRHEICATAPTLVILASFLLSFYGVVGYDQFQYRDGAHDLARFIEERQPSTMIVAGFDRNPQLTFYLEGADIGWRDDMDIRRVKPPSDRSQFRAWLSEQAGALPPDGMLVVEKDKFIRYEWVTAEEVTPLDFSVIFDSRRYAVFQRVPSTQFALLNPRPLLSPRSSSHTE